jgi:hypothetical protein
VTISPHVRTGQMRAAEDASADALSTVLARAETDVAFRTRLLTEPHRAIQDEFGIQVPHDFRLRFIERHSDVDALVVLPDLRPADGELSAESLEHVAGGAHAQNAHLAWKGSLAPKVSHSD